MSRWASLATARGIHFVKLLLKMLRMCFVYSSGNKITTNTTDPGVGFQSVSFVACNGKYFKPQCGVLLYRNFVTISYMLHSISEVTWAQWCLIPSIYRLFVQHLVQANRKENITFGITARSWGDSSVTGRRPVYFAEGVYMSLRRHDGFGSW